MRATTVLLLLLPPALLAQQAPPRFMYIYRDSLKHGVDSAYRAIEDEGAQICADLKCPNPYLAVTITRTHRPIEGSVWEATDSTLYVLWPVRTRQQAEALAREEGARIFAVRSNWSMPAAE